MTVWLLAHPALDQTLDRAPSAALASRIQVRLPLKPVIERARFHSLINHAFQQAGAQHTLLSDSALELVRQASRGLPRYAGRILKTSLQLAVPKGLNHLPGELIQQAIEELR
jgi:MSHA biogenesis protein MshM